MQSMGLQWNLHKMFKRLLFNPKKICCLVQPNCDNFNTTSGLCQKCLNGFQTINGTCKALPQNSSNNLHPDLGCKNWDCNKNICVQCSFRWILNVNKSCVPVSDFCKTYNSSGYCTFCYQGYFLQKGACFSLQLNQKNIFNVNCIQWRNNNTECISCAQGMALNQLGVCAYFIQNCVTYSTNGSCNECSGTYKLVNFSCIKKPSYKKIYPNIDPQAKCLDGSPSVLYFQQGTLKDKFLVYFLGGQDVGRQTINATLQAAYQRSQTPLGSSIYMPQDISGIIGGYLTDEKTYQGWNKVVFHYCDGAFHQGYTKQPFRYLNSTLYFRGSLITKSHFKWLIDNYNIDKASKIIISGGSAGAVSVFQWSSYLSSIVQNPDSLYFIPDSGVLFVPANSLAIINTILSNLLAIANVDQKTPLASCNEAYPGHQQKCLLLQTAYPFIQGRYLWINSQYDSYMIQNVLGIKCLSQGDSGSYTIVNCSTFEMQIIKYYRDNMVEFMNTKIKSQKNSAWLIGCSNHVYAFYDNFYDSVNEAVPAFSGNTSRKVIQEFALLDKYIWEQDGSWPSNKGCAY